MPLENASNISQLDESWPLGGDPIKKGDDHIRLLKDVLKLQFPGAGGAGFTTPIFASEAEINSLDGVTSNIQDQLDALEQGLTAIEGQLSAPVGTKMVFYNTNPPPGWTADSSIDNNMMRVVDGSITVGGISGGTDNPILHDKVPPHSHTGTSSSDGLHTHNYTRLIYGSTGLRIEDGDGHNIFFSYIQGTTVADGEHSHSLSVDNNVGENWTPKYVNMIMAVKE